MDETVTVYGPPTLIPGIVALPLSRVLAWYTVPEGWCTAITRTPLRGLPFESFTLAAIVPVVIPCAETDEVVREGSSRAIAATNKDL
jgi:hypothetical protein